MTNVLIDITSFLGIWFVYLFPWVCVFEEKIKNYPEEYDN